MDLTKFDETFPCKIRHRITPAKLSPQEYQISYVLLKILVTRS